MRDARTDRPSAMPETDHDNPKAAPLEERVDELIAEMDAACAKLDSDLAAYDDIDVEDFGSLDAPPATRNETKPETKPEPVSVQAMPVPEPVGADTDEDLDEQLASMIDDAYAATGAEPDTVPVAEPAAPAHSELDDELAGLATQLSGEKTDKPAAKPEPAAETDSSSVWADTPPARKPEPETKPEPKAAPKPATKPEVKAQPKPAPKPAPAAKTKPKPEPAPKPERPRYDRPQLEKVLAERDGKLPAWAQPVVNWLAFAGRFTRWAFATWSPPVTDFAQRHGGRLWRGAEPALARGVNNLDKPLAAKPKIVRDTVGWLASWTLFLAVCVWGFVLFVRQPAPTPQHEPPIGLTNPAQETASAQPNG